MPPPKLTVISGGASDGAYRATLIPTGISDPHGNEYYKSSGGNGPTAPSGGGGGGMTSIFRVDVHRDVQWMRVLWAILIPALAYFLFYFIGEMKDVRKDI